MLQCQWFCYKKITRVLILLNYFVTYKQQKAQYMVLISFYYIYIQYVCFLFLIEKIFFKFQFIGHHESLLLGGEGGRLDGRMRGS